MGEDSGEKTEEPTPHKLQEARKEGQIAKSKDLTAAFLLLIAFYSLKITGPNIWIQCENLSRYCFALMHEDLSIGTVGKLLSDTMWVFLYAVMPCFMIIVVCALILELFQTKFLIAIKSLEPKLEKLNPIEGVKKYFSLKQYVEFLKSLLKMIVVIWILISVLRDELYMVILSHQLSLLQTMGFVGSMILKVITRVGVFYIIIALFDYFYQQYEYIKGLRMSKKEIKDEYKKLEGDPMVKQRQRDAAREMSQGRQMGSVPDADVVVTNPVHIAIALSYQSKKMKAPQVTAKGKRLIAAEIRRIAKQHAIPIVENPPLARLLYEKCEINTSIPGDLYRQVAEVLAFVYNLKKKKKRRR